jgi:presenilin-like A22 family membrane protease
MKHNVKVISILLILFLLAQLIGIAVVNSYKEETISYEDESGNIVNKTTYGLPYGLDPPQETNPEINIFSFLIALFFAVFIFLILMKLQAEILLRIWFLLVVVIALSVTINSMFTNNIYSPIIAGCIAVPLGLLKMFRRSVIIHNFTELLIYPGIAAIFVPLLNLTTVSILFVIISIYDMYAVWHSGFMQKMAKYQIEKVKVFNGFFIPNIDKKILSKIKKSTKLSTKNVKVPIAILGGGDIIFPILMSGVVLTTLGLIQSIIIALGATVALAFLFIYSQKGKFYPAMPFISVGCFVGLAIAFLI